MSEAVSALLTLPGHHTWKLSSTGLLLLLWRVRGQRLLRTLRQLYHSGAWLPLRLPMGFQGLTSHLTDPAVDGRV